MLNYCPQCGGPVNDNMVRCPQCGESLAKHRPTNIDQGTQSFLWGLLGFFVPVAGLILYLVWNDERPEDAKAAGMGALISVIVSTVGFSFFATFAFGAWGSFIRVII